MSPTATEQIHVEHVPTSAVQPSPWLNPRKHFNKKKDDELAASVAQKGVLQPLLVRAVDDKGASYQILAGERRWRAAQKADLAELPVIVRNVSDKEAIEIAFTENDQREAMHPLDDARGYETWLRLDPEATIESIAAKLGRPVSHVRRRYRLLSLDEAVIAALEDDRISVTHAERIAARVPREEQASALAACFEQVFDFESGGMKDALAPVRHLDNFIASVRLDLQAETTQQDFPEMAADVARVLAAGATVLQLSNDHSHRKPKAGDPLPSNYWEECTPLDAGAQLGVFVVGRRSGERIYVRLKAEEAKPQKRGRSEQLEPGTGSQAPAVSTSSGTASPMGGPKTQREEEKYEATRIRDHRIQVAAFVAAAKTTKKITGDRLIELVIALSEQGGFTDALAQDLSAALKLPLDVFNFGVDERALRKLSPTQHLQVLTIFTLVANRHRLTVLGGYKAFGVNLKRVAAGVDRELAREKKAAKAAAAKAKKGAKK